MPTSGTKTSRLRETLGGLIPASIHHFCHWLLPFAIVVFSVAVFLGLETLYPATKGDPLHFRSLPIEVGHTDPRQAAHALHILPLQRQVRLLEGAWLSIPLPEHAHIQPMAVDFPSSSAEAIVCWRRDTYQQVGAAEGLIVQGAMRVSRLGYALMLGRTETPLITPFRELLCRVEFAEPGIFSAHLWSIPDLRSASDRFHRGLALLEGGIITLALFLAVLALRNREWAFLLLALWLMGNLRLGMTAMGWDEQWMGHAIPTQWLPLMRKFTLAAYYMVSYALFSRLIRPRGTSASSLLSVLQWLGAIQLIAAFVLPWSSFKLLSTVAWLVTLPSAIYLYSQRLRQRAEKTSHERSTSFLGLFPMALALAVIMSGLTLTLVGQEHVLEPSTAVLALLLSNVLVALTVSAVIRETVKERIHAQTELVTGYAVAPLGLFTLDGMGRFSRMNPILREMLGMDPGTRTPARWTDFFAPQNWEAVTASTLAGKEVEVDLPATEDRKGRYFALRGVLVDDHVEGSLQDITERARAMAELRTMVDNDPLTHALNRRGIEKQLEAALETLKTRGARCALAYMDLDHFKRINGLFGHTSGDEILKEVTARLRRILSARQPLGRIGSDEFVILFPGMDASEARSMAERIIPELNGRSYQVGQRFFHVKSAIGVVELNENMDVAGAMSAANRACRDARQQHHDVVVYELDSSELQAHTEELRLFDQLEGGTSPRGLYLEMQPIMAIDNPDATLNFEILLRVRDSQGRLLRTDKIVRDAEESGTITIIDKWVFSATLEWLSKHEDRLTRTQFVTVNLSGVSLNNDEFIDNLFMVLERHQRILRRLCVEITEGVALQNLERTRQLTTRLQSMGVRIALDDFGAGYTSFSYLKQLGADAVKIDGAFVRDMLLSDTNTAIVRTIVRLAKDLGMLTIAEWVEDIRTLEALRDSGVDYVQGYVVSPAVTPMEILDTDSLSDLVSNADTLAYIRKHSSLH